MPPCPDNNDWTEWKQVVLQNQERHEEGIKLLHDRISEERKSIEVKIDTMKNAVIGGLVVIIVEAFFLFLK